VHLINGVENITKWTLRRYKVVKNIMEIYTILLFFGKTFLLSIIHLQSVFKRLKIICENVQLPDSQNTPNDLKWDYIYIYAILSKILFLNIYIYTIYI